MTNITNIVRCPCKLNLQIYSHASLRDANCHTLHKCLFANVAIMCTANPATVKYLHDTFNCKTAVT